MKTKCTIGRIWDCFKTKDSTPCPFTELLVKSGYQQRSGGYIKRAYDEGILVDYKQNSPSQYWHLMTYCNSRNPQNTFSRSIVCGELIFWMAEVSNSVSSTELEELANRIIADASYKEDGTPIYDRIKWNKEIQEICFERIEEKVQKNLCTNEKR